MCILFLYLLIYAFCGLRRLSNLFPLAAFVWTLWRGHHDREKIDWRGGDGIVLAASRSLSQDAGVLAYVFSAAQKAGRLRMYWIDV